MIINVICSWNRKVVIGNIVRHIISMYNKIISFTNLATVTATVMYLRHGIQYND